MQPSKSMKSLLLSLLSRPDVYLPQLKLPLTREDITIEFNNKKNSVNRLRQHTELI